MNCRQLGDTLATNLADAGSLEAVISSNRGANQALGYFSAVGLLPLALAVIPNTAEKSRLDELQSQRDRIHRLSRAKNCPR